MEGLLTPEKKEVVLGEAEVRQTFKIAKVGTIAGCFVRSGVIPRTARVRVIRDGDRKSTRLKSSHSQISYAVFCLKKKKNTTSGERPSTPHFTLRPRTRSPAPYIVPGSPRIRPPRAICRQTQRPRVC